METVCQLNFNLLSSKEVRRVEAILREYLLRSADQVTVSRIGSSAMSIFSFLPHGFQFRKFIRMLNEADVVNRDSSSWTFNLTENVKNFLNQSTILFNGSGKFFYGFSDPKFAKKGNTIASIISNEAVINLYISDTDKAELVLLGVYLDNKEF